MKAAGISLHMIDLGGDTTGNLVVFSISRLPQLERRFRVTDGSSPKTDR
jgi:hypothetical protein